MLLCLQSGRSWNIILKVDGRLYINRIEARQSIVFYSVLVIVALGGWYRVT